MFEFFTQDRRDAISLIKSDHQKVKGLFDDFEKAADAAEKRKIAADAIQELKVHAAIEEEIFYAIVREQVGKKIMNEADEEHHVAKILIAELEVMDGTEEHYDAKFKVLSENVRHHIREEENEMLPKTRHIGLDLDAIGAQMHARKDYLMEAGVDIFEEEDMIIAVGNKDDSPARIARRDRPGASLKKSQAPKRLKNNTQAKLPKEAKSKLAKPAKKAKAASKPAPKKTIKLVKPAPTKKSLPKSKNAFSSRASSLMKQKPTGKKTR